MNKKKLYIALAILVVLLLATVIIYFCFFGRKPKDPDDKREWSDVSEIEYTDAFGNPIDDMTEIHNDGRQIDYEAETKKKEEKNKAAVEAIAGDLTIPDVFTVENAKGDAISDTEYGTQINYRLVVEDITLKYTIDREGTNQAEASDSLPTGMTLEKKQIEGIDVDIVSDGTGYICTWNDEAGSHKLVVPLEKTDANTGKVSEWIGLLIVKNK